MSAPPHPDCPWVEARGRIELQLDLLEEAAGKNADDHGALAASLARVEASLTESRLIAAKREAAAGRITKIVVAVLGGGVAIAVAVIGLLHGCS